MRPRILVTAAAALALLLTAPSSAGASTGTTADWLQFGHDQAHSGSTVAETLLNPGNVSGLSSAFQTTLPGTADAPPVELADVPTSGGVRDLLFLNTTDGWTVAVDAHSGAIVWSHQVGPGSCLINGTPGRVCYTTSAPAIDPNRQFVYSYGLDGKVHKYAVGSGAETTTGGWPEVTTLKPVDEKGSSDIAIATARNGVTYLYMANGGYPGDGGNYQGHITTVNLATGAQTVFNTQCAAQTVHFAEPPGVDCGQVQSAVWARPGITYDATTDLVYLVTGNGDFSGTAHDYGDTVLAIHPDGTGAGGGNPVDTYTPTEYQHLDDADLDFGSTAPAVLNPVAGSSVANLGVQSGKDGQLRLLDLADLSGQHGPNHTGGELQKLAVPQGGQVLTQPTTWRNPADGSSWVFVANGSGMSALKVVLTGATPSLVTQWKITTSGTTPVVANGVLYDETPGGVEARTPTTGARLWTSGAATNVHWQSPIVSGGYLYFPDGAGHLNAYTVPSTPTATTTTVTVSPDAAVGVAGVALFANVAPTSATGTVAFTDGNAPIAGCAARPVVNGYANCVTTFDTAGPRTLTATYSGNPTNAASHGSTTVTVEATPNPLQAFLGQLIAYAHTNHLLGL